MYKIKLPNFEGPFDLLLYFIKRDELNIYDIPIAKITEEYLKYIRLMNYFDLELAGEFLVMVATLMYIKTQMLLPITKSEDDEIEDPRTVLVQKLIEYKQFKEASKELSNYAENNKYVFYRKIFEQAQLNEELVYYENSTLFDLLRAFKNALERNRSNKKEHIIKLPSVSIKEKIEEIKNKLVTNKKLSFYKLVYGESRKNIVITFLAILEMIKSRLIKIYQESNFEDIVIVKPEEFVEVEQINDNI